MKKRSGPALSFKKASLKRCPECKGSRIIKPMFHQMICARCNGLGGVDLETGDALSPDNVIIQLHIREMEKSESERRLARQLADMRRDDESAGRGYGPGGARYHGD